MTYRDRLARLLSPAEREEAQALSIEIAARIQASADDEPEKPTLGVALPRPANGFRDSAIYAQRLLKTLGYYDAAVDGVAGEFTIKATREFLRENGLRMEPQITRDLLEALEEVRAERIAAAKEAAEQERAQEFLDQAVEHNEQDQS